MESESKITAVSPSGSGAVNVTVTGPGGTSATSSADEFAYRTGLAEGSPQLYSNYVRLPSNPIGVLGYGTLTLRSRTLEVQCASVGFGSASNEGSPVPRGRGEVLGFGAQAHEPAQPYRGCQKCSLLEVEQQKCPEIWVTDEPALSSGKRSEPLSTPWNVELRCGVREEEPEVPLVRIGIPNGAAPHAPGCAGGAEEVEVKNEESEREGCYASPAPPGCIKIDVVDPGTALEAVYEGSVWARVLNGFGNGLSASRLEFASGEPGKLHLSGNFEEAAEVTGVTRVSGLSDVELLQAK